MVAGNTVGFEPNHPLGSHTQLQRNFSRFPGASSTTARGQHRLQFREIFSFARLWVDKVTSGAFNFFGNGPCHPPPFLGWRNLRGEIPHIGHSNQAGLGLCPFPQARELDLIYSAPKPFPRANDTITELYCRYLMLGVLKRRPLPSASSDNTRTCQWRTVIPEIAGIVDRQTPYFL